MSTGPADEHIDIAVTLRDALSRPAKKVEKAIDDIRDKAKEASPPVDDLEAKIGELGDTSEEASEKVDGLSGALRRNRRETEESTRRTEQHRRTVSATHVVYKAFSNTIQNRYKAATTTLRKFRQENTALGRTLQQTGRNGGQALAFFGNYFTALKLLRGAFTSDLFLFVPQLVTGVFSLGAAAVAAIGPVGSLAGNLGLLAPGIALLMQLKSVVGMGFGGVGELATLLADPNADAQALAKAMKDLGPNARGFAVELANIRKQFKPIRKEVQEVFLDGLSPTLKTLVDRYLPGMQRNLVGTARGLNQAMKYAGDIYGRPENVAAFDRVMKRGADNSFLAGKGMSQFLLLLLRVTDAAGPAFVRVLDAAVTRIEWLADKADDGGLERFFGRSADTAFSFMRIVRDLSVGLYNLTKGAGPLTAVLGGGLKSMAADFREFTGSAEGQKRISDFFRNMIPNVKAIANLVGAISVALVGLSESPYFAALVNDLANNGIPALLRLFQTLESTVTPVILDLSAALATIEDYPNFFQPLADVLSILVGVLRVLVPVWNSLPGPIQSTIAYVVGLVALGIPLSTALMLWVGGFRSLIGVGKLATKTLMGASKAAAAARLAFGALAIVGGLAVFGNMVIDAQAAKVKIDDVADALARVGGMGPVANQKGLLDVGKIGAMPGLGPKTNQEVFNNYGNLAETANKGFWAGFARTVSLGTYSRTLDAQTEKFDQGLANLVNSGKAAEAKSSYEQLMASVRASGGDVDAIGKKFTLYNEALQVTGPAAQAAAAQQREIEWGLRGANGELLTQNERLQNNISLMQQASGQALGAREAQRQYQEALSAANSAIEQNGRTLDITTEKGRANQSALDNIANAGYRVIESMQATNAPLGELQAAMQTTRDNFITTAQSMGMSSDEANKLADKLGLIPKNVTSAVAVSISGEDRLAYLKAAIDNIKSKNVTITTTAATSLARQELAQANRGRFSGGSVLPGFAYNVNEKGPESFVSNSGKVAMLGDGKMTQMRFSEPGYVVPNRVTTGASDSGVPDRVLTALRRAQEAPYMTERSQVPQPSDRAAEGRTGDTYNTRVTINGPVDDEVDIERAVERAHRKNARAKARRRNR